MPALGDPATAGTSSNASIVGVTTQQPVAVYNCSRLGRVANPPGFSFSDCSAPPAGGDAGSAPRSGARRARSRRRRRRPATAATAGFFTNAHQPGLEVVGEAARVGALSQRVDGHRQLITGLVDLLLDGVGIAVRHIRPPYAYSLRPDALPNYPRSAGANPSAPVDDEKGIRTRDRRLRDSRWATKPPRSACPTPTATPSSSPTTGAARSSCTSTPPHRPRDAPSRPATSATASASSTRPASTSSASPPTSRRSWPSSATTRS